MKPLVTVIIPIYNTEARLAICIESVLSQTYKSLEIILINDGSTDNSAHICDDFAKKDSRVKVIHQKNAGVSSARNAGLDIMHGDYFTFLDSDDYFESYAIEKFLQKIDNADIIVSSIKTKTANGIDEKMFGGDTEFAQGKTEIAKLMLQMNYSPQLRGVAGKLFRCTEKISCLRYSENYSFGEDTLFNIECYKNASSIKIIEDCVYIYWLRAQSLSAQNKSLNFYLSPYMHILRITLEVYETEEASQFYEKACEISFYTAKKIVFYSGKGKNTITQIYKEVVKFFSDLIVVDACQKAKANNFFGRFIKVICKHKLYRCFTFCCCFYKYTIQYLKPLEQFLKRVLLKH